MAVDAVRRALADSAVAAVEIVEWLPSSCAQVARLRVAFSDGRAPVTMIAKRATGDGVAAARRELRFYERIAPQWAHPAPTLLGALEEADGGDCLLLLTEDLEATGHALPRGGVSEAQLHAVVDTLVGLHAAFWEDLHPDALDPAHPIATVTRAAQAGPAEVIAIHAAAVREAAASFLGSADVTAAERAWLPELVDAWERQFVARVAGDRAITLIHADFHLLGNIFFAHDSPRPRVIDWSELKPGLGPHDLAYCLTAVPADDRPARDHALLRRYWDGLAAAGIDDYGWDLCQWDYRFSQVTKLFQSVFQRSATWFRRSAALLEELDGRAALRDPPPVT